MKPRPTRRGFPFPLSAISWYTRATQFVLCEVIPLAIRPIDETWNYLRMSTGFQEDSPVTQDQHTEEFIRAQGLPPWTRTYYDLAESAGTMEKRPGILQLIADAETTRPGAIVFYKLDRAFRNSTEQAIAMRRLKRAGIRVLKVRDPNIDGPQGEMMDTILGAVNQFERELTGVRIRDHNQAMAQRGEWPGGAPPFGYRYIKAERVTQGRKRLTVKSGQLLPDPVERPIARRIWEWALAGYRKTEIVDMANAAGYRRRNGALWNKEALTQMLINKTYAGYIPFARHKNMHGRMKRQHDRAEWYQGQHEPTVSLEEWLQVQATVNALMGQRTTHSRPRTQLAGLMRCLLCGGPVVGNSYTSDGGYHYTCQAAVQHEAGHPIWSRRDWAVHLVLQAILDEVADNLPHLPPPSVAAEHRAAVEREIAALRNRVRRLRTLYLAGEYNDDMDSYQRDKRDLDAQLAAAEAKLAGSGPGSDELAERWAILRDWEATYLGANDNVREQQRFWASVVERVETDGRRLVAHLRDFGPTVHRVWEIDLPPARSRRPGSRAGRGVVGQRGGGRLKSRSRMLNGTTQPRAVVPTT